MARIIRVGGSSSETSWHEALKDLRADDVLMLGPGFYYLPQGLTLTDITIKGQDPSQKIRQLKATLAFQMIAAMSL